MAAVLDLFMRHLVNPILPPKEVAQEEHPDVPYFVLGIRAASIAVAFFIGVPPMFNGVLVYLLSDESELTGVLIVLLGVLVYFFFFCPPYLLARFHFKYPAGVLCDSIAVGMLGGCLCWDVAGPTFVPMGFGGLFVSAFAGWCATPRGPLIVIIAVLFTLFQLYNHIVWRHNLHDEGIHYKDQAFVYYNALSAANAAISNVTSMTAPALAAKLAPLLAAGAAPQDRWSSPFPFHLHPSSYFFPHIVDDVLVGLTFSFIAVLVFVTMQIQSKEFTRQSAAARSAVETVETIADALRRYDTTAANVVLAKAKGAPQKQVRDMQRRSVYAQSIDNSSFNASLSQVEPKGYNSSVTRRSRIGATTIAGMSDDDVEDSDGIVPVESALSEELVASLTALVANLNAYRPYLPNWLLVSEESAESDAAKPEDETNSVRIMSTTKDDIRNTAASQRSSNQSDSVTNSSVPNSGRRVSQKKPAAATAPTALQRGAAGKSTCAFAIVTFEPRRSDGLSTQESLAAFVDLLHAAAHETKGAVHSFMLGEAAVSWNCAMACANPESKAALFTARLRDAAEGRRMADSLDLVRCSVAVVTGTARCETAGTEQRAVTSLGPHLASRLRGLSAFARAAAADLGFAGICDAATAAGATSHYIMGPAGVVNVAGGEDRPWAGMLLPPAHTSAPASHALTASSLAPAFEVIGGRGDHGDEWLYAMVDGPSEIAAKAVNAAAEALGALVATGQGAGGSPVLTPLVQQSSALPEIPGLHCGVCHAHSAVSVGLRGAAPRAALQAALELLEKAAKEGDGPTLSQRPMWQAWYDALSAAIHQ